MHKNRAVGREGDEEGTVRRHVWVDGRVQGVWFRDSCRTEAERAGVAGWITNRADGRVEAIFEGSPAAVDQMVEWCHHGSRRADVTHVELREEAPEGLEGFLVR